jgi:diaminohydroxyphosphoribosylaminopyrimidine deaminase / 5-amino-6-(5-phosphoribosylamino)uracil reductase
MQRCLELAKKGAGYVAPNPMVGAVLVHEDKIIGEGWHQQYGEAHAEVNCIASVKEEDRSLIAQSTMYVSLEPCAHFGKTPPCVDLIVQHKVPKVIIGCRDPFEEVNGKGIEKLRAAGVEVIAGVLENECKELNKRFFTYHTKQRPYIILKWAQTADGKIASLNPSEGRTSDSDKTEIDYSSQIIHQNKTTSVIAEAGSPPLEGREAAVERLLISNEYSNRLVHKWRSEEAAILVGTNTALLDDPELTTRLWPGPSPVRLVLDRDLKLPSSLKIFNQEVKTIIFNCIKQKREPLVIINWKAKPILFYQ